MYNCQYTIAMHGHCIHLEFNHITYAVALFQPVHGTTKYFSVNYMRLSVVWHFIYMYQYTVCELKMYRKCTQSCTIMLQGERTTPTTHSLPHTQLMLLCAAHLLCWCQSRDASNYLSDDGGAREKSWTLWMVGCVVCRQICKDNTVMRGKGGGII